MPTKTSVREIVFGSGPLMLAPEHLRSLASRVGQLDDDSLQTAKDILARTSHKYEVVDGTAHFDLLGPIMSEPNWMMDYFGIDYTVTSHFAAAISEASARSDVRRIMVNADTPGGHVTGLQGAFEAVRDSAVPVVATVGGMLASAGLYILAGADQIIAQPESIVGSIGTVTTIRDYSKMFEEAGIQTHVVSTGPRKGMGTTGAEVTEDQIDALQGLVDTLGNLFIEAVADGRGMSVEDVRALATGDVWVGEEARSRGLVDQVSSQPLAAASQTAREMSAMDKKEMADLVAAHPQHAALIVSMADADLTDVNQAIEQADHKQAIESAEKRATEAEAKAAELATKLESAEKRAGEAEAKAQKALDLGSAQPRDPGGEPPEQRDEKFFQEAWKNMPSNEQRKYLDVNDYVYCMLQEQSKGGDA